MVVRVQFEEALHNRLRDALAGVRRTQPEALLQESGLLAWLDTHREDLRRLVSDEHVAGLDALFRLIHTPEAYETDVPRATASRWTVELREAWRSGVAITVHAGQQAIALRPAEDRPNSAIGRFTSPPVDIERVSEIEVTFAPEEATKTVVKNIAQDMGVLEQVGETVAGLLSALPGDMEKMIQRRVEETREYVLSRLRVSAHTDPSDDLPRSKTYQIVDHSATGGGTTLKATNPSHAIEVSNVPNVDFLLTSTRRYRDYERLEKLAQHIKQNRMAYLRALWLREDPDRRALRFAELRDRLEEDGASVPLLQLIENQPVGVFGNQVAFPILKQGSWKLYTPVDDDETVEERLVTLPSRGVYAETLLSKCNAREIRDVKRMYDPDERCQEEAPSITGITPGSRRSEQNLQPSDMPSPVVQPQTAPAAPAPQAMAAALQAIASGGTFRDMSLGSETVQSARALADRAMRESGAAQRKALDALDQKLAQAQSEAQSDAEREAMAEARRQAGVTRQAAQHAATQAHRQSDAQTNRDHQQNLDEARSSGALSEEAHRRGSERLHNAAESGGKAQGGPADAEAAGRETVEEDRKERQSEFLRSLPSGPEEGSVLVARIFWPTARPRPGKLIADFSEDDRRILDKIMSDPNFGDQEWSFYGHADARSYDDEAGDTNKTLSDRRAAAVFRYLSGVAMDENRIAPNAVIALTGLGASESDPSQPEQFPFDRRTDVYARHKARSGYFTRAELDDASRARLEALADNPDYSEDELEIVLDRVRRAYVWGNAIQDLVEQGTIDPLSGNVYGPCYEELEFRPDAPLDVLEGCVQRFEPPFSSSGPSADLTFLIATVKHQRSIRNNAFYRVEYLSQAEGKDQSAGFFLFATESSTPVEDLPWYPPPWSELSAHRQNRLEQEGLAQDYMSGREHRQRVEPYLERQMRFIDQFMEMCTEQQRHLLKHD